MQVTNIYISATPSSGLPPCFPNSNTGDQEIMLNPYNIPIHKMSFKITVEIYINNAKKLMREKEFDLTVNKKQS